MKKILLIIISIFTLVTLTGCASPNRMGSVTSSQPKMESIIIELKSLSSDKAVFTVTNTTANSYYYIPDDSLEKKEDNEWKVVPPKEPLDYAAVVETLEAYKSIDLTLSFEYYNKLSKGTYRFVKEFTNEQEALTVKEEFEIK